MFKIALKSMRITANPKNTQPNDIPEVIQEEREGKNLKVHAFSMRIAMLP